MKFSNVIVALFAAAIAYSKATFDGEALVAHLKESNPDCAAEISKYQVCLINPTSAKDCKAIKGDDCSSFYSKPSKYIGDCVGNQKVDLFDSSKLSELKSEYKEICKKIENKTTTKKTTTTTKATTTAEAAATGAAASAASAVSDAAATATSAVSGAVAAATDAAGNAVASATSAAAAAAATATGEVNNVIANANNATASATGAAAEATTSDATKLSVSLFVTVALAMLSFY